MLSIHGCGAIALLLIFATLPVRADDGAEILPRLKHLPADCEQVVLVQTEDWPSVSGVLGLWRRKEGSWTSELDIPRVVVGRTGLGWGVGLHDGGAVAAADPSKKEGDGRGPAGIFRLDTGFGYAKSAPAGGKGYPYRQCTKQDYFVDDPASKLYNSWQASETGAGDWKSAESMLRDDHLYRLGVVVGHNLDRPIPGSGSAIFLHIWRREGKGTAGCTAMPEADMEHLLKLLDPAAHPVLVQGPRSAIEAMTR